MSPSYHQRSGVLAWFGGEIAGKKHRCWEAIASGKLICPKLPLALLIADMLGRAPAYAGPRSRLR